MIDTSLMVTDYPEPQEPKLKCFKFEFTGTLKGLGIIYAEDIKQAKEGAINGEYDDIIDTWGMEIEEITEIEEE
jgi:hypothetical protein